MLRKPARGARNVEGAGCAAIRTRISFFSGEGFRNAGDAKFEGSVRFGFLAMGCCGEIRAGPGGFGKFRRWHEFGKDKKRKRSDSYRIFFFGTPPGARTLDPNIKSVVLYQLS